MRTSFLLFLMIGLVMAGCDRTPNARWMQGKWVLDEDYTRRHAKEEDLPPEKGIAGFATQLARNVAEPFLLGILKNAEITITADEVITTINGVGRATKYTFVEIPDRNTAVIKMADGEVTTYYREGDRIATLSSGIRMKVYLKRAR